MQMYLTSEAISKGDIIFQGPNRRFRKLIWDRAIQKEINKKYF